MTDDNDVIQECALAPWSVLEQYRIEEILRYDLFSITYRASNIKFDQLVVIKEFLPQDLVIRKSDDEIIAKFSSDEDVFQKGLKYFIEEAESLSKFSHPHIVRVLRYFRANGTAYMVMLHEDGVTLRKQLDQMGLDNTMPEDRIKLWLRDILDGLDAIHEKGIYHRDIRPDTIFLKKDGPAMLIDFGAVCYALNNESKNENTLSPSGYSSDDLFADEGEGGLWADIYQLGAVVYECVTGQELPEIQVRVQASANDEPDPILEPLKQAGDRGYSKNFLDTIVPAMSPNVTDRRSAIEALEELRLTSDKLVQGKEKKEDVLDKTVSVSEPEEAPVEEILLGMEDMAEPREVREEEVEDESDISEFLQVESEEEIHVEADEEVSVSEPDEIPIEEVSLDIEDTIEPQEVREEEAEDESDISELLQVESEEETPIKTDEEVSVPEPEEAPVKEIPVQEAVGATVEAPEAKEEEAGDKPDVPEYVQIDDKEKVRGKDKKGGLLKVGLIAILVMGLLAAGLFVFLRPGLKVVSEPSASTVFLDEKYTGETPLSIRMWMGGKHIIKVTKEGRNDFEQIIEMQFGTTKEVNAELVPRLLGGLTVQSDPEGANVYLDGQMKGVTPLRLDKVKKGAINLEIKKDHYSTVKRNLVVNPSLGETTVDIHLESLCGSLVVKSSPGGATVFVDGKEKGVTPLNLENVEKGLHIVKVVKHCFSVVEKKVDIIVSKKTDIDVRMESLCGSLVVKSSPGGATVFVDGKEKGVTPLRLDNVRKGNLNIKLIKKGFETESKIITVNPSKKFNFFVKLRQPIISSDGRFVDHRNGTVTDTKTGLMWTREDSYVHLDRYLNWEQSRSYLNKLSTGGYSDWRLPTVAELREIYEIKKSNTDKDGDIIHIDPIFSSGGTFWSWSSEEQGKCCAKVFLFIDGSVIKNDRMFSYERGVRAVRP
ncbi:MAG: PEGA domain-containing protein [Deltaproteobacteria bacterium]|nr:PEGA domain-containing protein [Deltaproteobacteria bacterium]